MRTTDLVIPVLNEAGNIPALFDAILPLKNAGVIRNIVIGDNGSTDGSPELVAKRGGIVVHEPYRGYGAACLKAIQWIADQDDPPDAIAFFDADLSDDPEWLKPLIDTLDDHVIAIGCRPKLAERGAMNPPQRFGNAAASVMMSIFTGRRYRDLGPMRVILWETYWALEMQDKTWGWTVEMQAKAAIAKLTVSEIDVPYRKRHSGKSKISGSVIGSLKAAWKIAATILAIRLHWKPIHD